MSKFPHQTVADVLRHRQQFGQKFTNVRNMSLAIFFFFFTVEALIYHSEYTVVVSEHQLSAVYLCGLPRLTANTAETVESSFLLQQMPCGTLNVFGRWRQQQYRTIELLAVGNKHGREVLFTYWT